MVKTPLCSRDLPAAFKRLKRAVARGNAHDVARLSLGYTEAYCRAWREYGWFQATWGRVLRRALGVRRV